jgi:hypothetical protein
MNLYLVLALALGAISGVVEAPVRRPVLSTLASRRGGRVDRQSIRNPLIAPRRPRTAAIRTVFMQRWCESPLNGAGTARAPAMG